MTPDPTPRPAAGPVARITLVALVALLLQAMLVANPGYFSHDELQWAAAAERGTRVDWLDVGAFQYRPLTFTLWLALSRALFETPQLFHLALALLGAANAALLASVLGRAGAPPRVAMLAPLAFVLSPYAMYVHGWVGTLGDLLWVGLGLVAARAALGRPPAVAAAVAALCTALALLAKEAALSLPALAVLMWMLDPARRRTWAAMAAGAALPALAYLALRWPVLAAAPADGAYAWTPLNLPVRWVEYQLYTANVPVFEVHSTLRRGLDARIAITAALWLGVVAGLARTGWRLPVAFVLGGAAALGPVLVLGQSATQYGYGFAAWSAGVLGLAWPRLPRSARVAVGVFALLAALHALGVARQMHRVGQVQARFSPALAEAVRRAPAPVSLAPMPEADAWIFQRLTHEVPAYRGVPLEGRVRLLPAGSPADYRILPDGRLAPSR